VERSEVVGKLKTKVHALRGWEKVNGPYRIGESNHLLYYVSCACTTTDEKDVATAVHIGFAMEYRVEDLSNRRRGFPRLLPLELGLVWKAIMSSCNNEMVESGVSGALVCVIQCAELPVTRDSIPMPVGCQNFVA
jgi:hypothetical protein